MRALVTCVFGCILPFLMNGQVVEVDGKLKVSEMDTINTEDNLVVTLQDGTLATRVVSSLPSSSNTGRTWQTDLLLTSTLCNCGTLRPAIMQSLLDNGYTIQDLLEFGLSIRQLYDADVSVQVLRDGGLSVQELYSGGIFISELILGGVTIQELISIGIKEQQFLTAGVPPFDLYNAGIILDSIIGKIYLEGMIFYMNTNTGEGLVALTQDLGDPSWGCLDILVGASGIAIGSGYQNTQAIMDDPCFSQLVLPITNGQYTEWFVPSKDELNEMYMKIGPGAPPPHTNIGNFLTNKHYWTSTEENASNAWRQSFSDGTASIYLKDFITPYPYSRLIKAF